MKSIFNETDKNEILARVEKLTPESKAQWGKMNVAQMLAHSTAGTEMPIGDLKVKQLPISFIGQFLKKTVIYGDKPLQKNTPTSVELKVVDPREFAKEKAAFITVINKIYEGGHKGIKSEKHPFFGKMTTEEWGILNYKHADHHLRQFGV